MLSYPREGQVVQMWYRDKTMPLHGLTGTIVIVSRGPGPRNHGIAVDGVMYVVNRGHLRKVGDE